MMNYIFVPYIIMALFIGCIPREPNEPVSKSLPVLQDKSSQLPVAKKQSLYVKEKKVTISPVEEPNTNGSLFNLNDERNYLFVEKGPLVKGKYLDVEVATNRKPASGKTEKEPNETVETTGSTDDMIKDLPSLDPEDENMSVLESFKMKVSEVLPNGDVLAIVRRSSMNDEEEREVIAQARIPYSKLISNDPLTTSDLTDVKFVDSDQFDHTERHSSGWENEYTLRLSGFSEAKSKMASRLEKKRQQLLGVRKRLQNRLASFSKEREQFSKDRTDLAEKQKKIDEQLKEVNEKLEERDGVIKSQKEEIAEKDKQIKDSSRPEEKPGDNEDGAEGG